MNSGASVAAASLADKAVFGSEATFFRSFIMTKLFKPGSNSGPNGGIFQEQGPRGGRRPNFTTIPENRTVPPTSTPGSQWVRVKTTPKGHK